MLPKPLISEALFSKMRINNNSSFYSFIFFPFIMNYPSVQLLEISSEE